MARMAVLAKMERMVNVERMAKMVETVAVEAIVIGDVEGMEVTEEMLIKMSRAVLDISISA